MNKIPFWCPHCKKVIEKIDYKYLEKYDCCGDCFINYIDGQHDDKSKEQISEIIKNKIKSKEPTCSC